MKSRSKLPYFLSFSFISVFSLILSGCTKIEVNFPNVPVISFSSASVAKTIDSLNNVDYKLKLIISFTDGNGNIGLGPSDTTGSFSPLSPYYYNLWVGYYEYINETFIHVGHSYPFGTDTINYNGRIPVITPAGKLKAITGTIEYDIDLGSGTKSGVNTIRFDYILIDRALNKSNKVISIPIILPP